MDRLFEFFFKYRPLVFEQGDFAFTAPSSVRLWRSLVKCFMSPPFAASRKVRYMIRVCQFWYGLPLDVAMTCTPDGSGSPPRSPPDDAPPRDDPWCPSSSTTTSSYTTSSMTSTSSSLR